jgi:hypothetical protein
MCKSLGEDFDGRVLNPLGVEVDLPFWAFKRLKKLHLLERDQQPESLVTPTIRACRTLEIPLRTTSDNPTFR